MVAYQPENGVRTILSLGNGGVARALALGFRHTNLGLRKLQTVGRIALGPGDFLARQLAGADRVEALDALSGLAVGDRLDLKRVQLAELGDLVE